MPASDPRPTSTRLPRQRWTRHRWSRALITLLGMVTAMAGVIAPAPAAAEPDDSSTSLVAQVLAVSPQHPRLLVTPSSVDDLRTRVEGDARLQRWQQALVVTAEGMLTEPVPIQGGGNVSGDLEDVVKKRVYTLGLLYLLTDDRRYADRAVAEVMAVSSFTTWNPSHFLDVAEMTQAVAIGYDWLYPVLTDQQRATIRQALLEKSLRPAWAYYGQTTSFFTQTHNWNLVCNTVALGALAIAEDEPEVAEQVLAASVASIRHGITEYAPDGGYAESPVYWAYGTDALVSYLAALTTATGSDQGLGDLPGLAETGWFGLHVTGPTGLAANFGDGGTDFLGSVTPGWQLPHQLWLAQRYDLPTVAAWEAERADLSPSPLDLIWYDPGSGTGQTHPASTDATFAGVELATARSGWSPQSVGVAFKGLRAGYDQVVAHENLDAGNLTLDALGVRWFEELGGDGYGLPGYFDWKLDHGGRWDHLVARTEGQNTVVIGGGPVPSTALTAGATVETRIATPRRWAAVTDLTAMYAGTAVTGAQRGVQLFDDRRQVLVQDEIVAANPVDVVSVFHTRADVTIASDGRSAVLTRGGQRVWLQLLGDAGLGGQFTVGRTAPLPSSPAPAGQSAQPGLSAVTIRLSGVTQARFAVRVMPLDAGQQPPTDRPALVPLDAWAPTADDATTTLSGISVDGVPLPGFAPDRFRHDVVLPGDAETAPRVSVTATRTSRVSKITQADDPSSELGMGVATITTEVREGRSWRPGPTYRVHFRQPGRLGTSLPVVAARASSDDGNPAGGAVDGNLGTRWTALGDGVTLTLDLGRPSTVAAITGQWANGFARTSRFDVVTSTDGVAWSPALLGASTRGGSDNVEAFTFDPRAARYVRLVGHGNSVSGYTSILELRVHATAASALAEVPNLPPRLTALSATPAAVTTQVGASTPVSLAGLMTDGAAADLSHGAVVWQSLDPTVATVSSEGLVTAVAGGSTTVTALVTLGSGFAVARVPVTVDDPGHVAAVADGFVFAGTPTTGNSKGTTLEVRNNPTLGSGYERIAYLTFAAPQYGCRVTRAVLHLSGQIATTESSATDAIRVAESGWVEGGLTWANRPDLGATLGTVTLTRTAGWVEVDLTDHVRAQLCAGQEVRLAIASTVSSYGPLTRYASREASTGSPYLELTLA
ncbi:CBM96 family carbohydrate-binding protein [Aestuariimicrobium soli]|uniref:CBM96 family carbohydrate-binding protein n=1 Tax=Aestuariimicrobium soli TaxID=2035834 RepID=UPI003EBD0C67